MKQRELCGDCGHGAHTSGPCTTVTVDGPPSIPKSGAAPEEHLGRNVNPCECQESTPYRNGHEIL
jgi:hypothetical protein